MRSRPTIFSSRAPPYVHTRSMGSVGHVIITNGLRAKAHRGRARVFLRDLNRSLSPLLSLSFSLPPPPLSSFFLSKSPLRESIVSSRAHAARKAAITRKSGGDCTQRQRMCRFRAPLQGSSHGKTQRKHLSKKYPKTRNVITFIRSVLRLNIILGAPLIQYFI